jgi:hypothetical protein
MRRSMWLAVAMVVVVAGVGTAPGASAAQLATVSVDLARPVGPFPFGMGRQLSAIPQSWRYGQPTLDAVGDLRLERTRVWLRFTRTVDPQTRTPDYARWHDYLETYHARAQRLLVNWQSDYEPLVTEGTWSENDLFAAERDMLAHYKRRFPKIELIEVENEDLMAVADAPDYYRKYRFMYRVVNAVNAMGLPGAPLKVGGPTLDVFSELRMGAFLDLYRADTDPAKRLDFLSYHQYLINISGTGDWTRDKDNPASVVVERARLDALLRTRGLPSVPALVTETGIFPGTRASDRGFEADLHIQAAALASLHYHYAGQRDVIPMDWTLDHPENDRKDLFADTANGTPHPYYNALRMLSMLPDTRYHAASDTLSARGVGVYGLAAAGPTRVAAMTWNYQWTQQNTYDSRIVFSNFPTAFRTSNVLVTRYRIDNDVHAGPLQPVEQFVIGPRTTGTYHSQTLPLEPNELRLTVLTPTTAPVGTRM